MIHNGKLLMGKGDEQVYLEPSMLNRHGLIAGATGTGKTVTIKVMAEGLSDLGIPVFMADIKGDVSGLGKAGEDSEKMRARLENIGIDPAEFTYHAYPIRFWDVFGKHGTPVRAAVSDMGPMLLARIMGLTEVQEGVLNIVFKIADDRGWKLLDFKDLKAMLSYVGEHSKEFSADYGNASPQSIGAIQRNLLKLQSDGAEKFFGEPELDIMDWIQTDKNGRGVINILHCVELYQHPTLYATFMLWLMSELFEVLPEVGDAQKPKMVFFFDEAHLLFKDMPRALTDKIVSVVKLIRSKGVGIFFITQSPSDIPDDVLAQLNNRVQHALRAYTPAEQKAVKAAARSFRENPAFKTEEVISALGMGCALVSFLNEEGIPSVVQKATICPPQSSFGALDDAVRAQLTVLNPLHEKYVNAVDSESAYELLEEQEKKEEEEARKLEEEKQREKEREKKEKERGQRRGKSALERSASSAMNSAMRSIGRSVGQQITRGILGSSSKTTKKAAGSFMGSLLSGFFR